ncbi:MAG: hypothetical protein KDJ98_14785 [Rhodobacteraceae bacterium]|nr:hypothetical protein [Paracoccaceae bacterium]
MFLAVWLGLQPLGAWLAPVPALPRITAETMDEVSYRGEWWIASFLQGHRWQADTEQQMSRRFRIRIPVDTATDETLHLWVPQFEQRLRVLTPEGHLIHDSIVSGFRGGPIRTAAVLVDLPPDLVTATGGVFDLVVEVGLHRVGSLGPVFVAPWRDLSAAVLRQRLFESTVRPAMLGALLFLAVMSVGFVALRPKDDIYYWLAGTMIPYAMTELGLITAYVPSLSQIDDQFFAVSGIGALQVIGLLLGFKDRPPPRRISIALFLIYLGLLVATFWLSQGVVVRVTLAMVLMMTLPGAVFLVSFGFESQPGRRLRDAALAVSLIMYFAGIVHDFLLKLGFHDQGIYVFRYVSFVLLVGIFAIVVKRQSGIADELDASNERLRLRLREQEAELAAYHHRESETLQARAAEAERERITADLHDGMAGYLATIVALSERDVSDGAEISNLAKDALTDLRFVIDATSLSSPDLRLTLAILRERCLQPLDALGIELRWSMIELPDDIRLSHEDNLHVLRILQEALNNAVRHGRPNVIEVTGRSVRGARGDAQIELILENRGGLAPDPDRDEAGHGTVNMAKRVAALGGELDLTPLADGVRLRLILPMQR